MEFFNRSGDACCHLVDGEYLYLWKGKPVGYLVDGKVYGYKGRQLGWFENGWLYDRSNRPALFTTDAIGGPVKPVRKVKPVKGVRQVRPVRSVRQIGLVKPARSLSWSPVADETYFAQ